MPFNGSDSKDEEKDEIISSGVKTFKNSGGLIEMREKLESYEDSLRNSRYIPSSGNCDLSEHSSFNQGTR